MKHHYDTDASTDLHLIADGNSLGDAESLAIASGLDALGEAERGAAPPGLNDRVFRATRDRLGPRVVARLALAGSTDHAIGAGRGRMLTPLRAAAGLALAATVGISILAGRTEHAVVAATNPPAIPFEKYIDAWASNSGEIGGDLAARASALDAETSALLDSLASGTASYDLWAEEGAL